MPSVRPSVRLESERGERLKCNVMDKITPRQFFFLLLLLLLKSVQAALARSVVLFLLSHSLNLFSFFLFSKLIFSKLLAACNAAPLKAADEEK